MSLSLITTEHSSLVHISRNGTGGSGYSDSPSTLCGAYDRWSKPYLVKMDNERYPESLDDICSTCAEKEEAQDFLADLKFRDPPKMVQSELNINVRVNKIMTLEEAQELVEGMQGAIDANLGNAERVKFNIKFKG